MLVLNVKRGDSIFINKGTIKITLLKDSYHLRIGIEAPKHVDVWRGKLWDKLQENKNDEC